MSVEQITLSNSASPADFLCPTLLLLPGEETFNFPSKIQIYLFILFIPLLGTLEMQVMSVLVIRCSNSESFDTVDIFLLLFLLLLLGKSLAVAIVMARVILCRLESINLLAFLQSS